MNAVATASSSRSHPFCSPASRITKSLLGYGVLAGPLYLVVAFAQALLRPGFDLAHDDVSLLANGAWGWVQVANFIVTGVMVIAAAAGIRRALARGPGAASGSLLLGIFGLGLIGAGIFVADPMYGFPPGAPAGHPTTISLHGVLHIMTAGIGFLAFVAACFMVARRFASSGRTSWAWTSRLCGVAFLAGFVGVASGSNAAAVVAGFWIAVVVAFGWLAATSLHLYRVVSATDAPLA